MSPILTISRGNTSKSESGILPKHLPVLDGLRGLAILGVLAGHFFQKSLFTCDPFLANAFSRIAGAGAYGVELFFVLSGFLITGILVDNKDSPGSLRKFYVRRCLRIFPLYYLALTIIFVVLPHVVEFDKEAEVIAGRQIWVWTYLANWPSLGWIWDDSEIFVIGHFWSLCVEEHFYAFWPALVYTLSRRFLTTSCLLLILLGLLSRLTSAIMGPDAPALFQWSTFQRIDGLAIGAFLALAVRVSTLREVLPAGKSFRRAAVALSITMVGIVGLPRWMNTELVGAFRYAVIAAFSGLVVLGAVRSRAGDLLNRFLSSPILVTFGKYSYGLYVIHGILRPQFAKVLELGTPMPSSQQAAILYQSIYYLFAIGISFIIAYMSYHLFETNFLAMKRYVAYRGETVR